jgi:hypothetical protein
MTTFDALLPALAELLKTEAASLKPYLPILVNRDLNGRIRLIVDADHEASFQDNTDPQSLGLLAKTIHEKLAPHVWQPDQIWLFEENIKELIDATLAYPLADSQSIGIDGVLVADRLAQEATWASINPETSGVPRAVFYSIKGGVGRSTALAATAWALAEAGKRVLVLDLDLESPGLSSSLLPEDRQPAYGITDWLVEDLVGNGDAVIKDLFTRSPLSHDGDGDGEIIVVPAHGHDPGEYISKLGRVWMPSFQVDGTRQMWSFRLARLLRELEQTHQPDIVLIDSRAGIDEVASACVTDLGANRIYLFALDGLQTWIGYRMLFQHWLQHGVAQQIREHIQLVGAMLPTWHDQPQQAAADLKEHSFNLFLETLYDEQPAAINEIEDLYPFSFDIDDPDAPHNPLLIPWNQSFAAIQTHHARLEGIDSRLVELVYDELIADLSALLEGWAS